MQDNKEKNEQKEEGTKNDINDESKYAESNLMKRYRT